LLGGPTVVDISSADPAAATALAARLTAAGVPVGATTTTDAATSTVQYPDGQGGPAGVLATALGWGGSEQVAPVDHVTVVLGRDHAVALPATGPIC
jgi:LytR cell envelope-related transcriptional attenuator